ncbi:MAG: tetratricopeptide repeat protein [Planctomycetaceae bacterium]
MSTVRLRQDVQAVCWLSLAVMFCAAIVGCSWLRTAVNRHQAEADRLVEQARDAQAKGDAELAVSLLSKAADVNPDDAEIPNQLADVLLAQGRKDDAVAPLRNALEKTPNDATGHARLARLLFDLERFGEAEQSIDVALELDPKLTNALLLKSQLAERNHNDQQALEVCHRVLAAEPENAEAQLRIAGIHLRSSQPDRAAPLLRAICQSTQATAAQKADAYWSLGISYGQQRRWADAASALAAACKNREKVSADEWYRLAYAYFLADDDERASAALSRAFALEPAHAASLAMAEALHATSFRQPIVPVEYAPPQIPRPAGW